MIVNTKHGQVDVKIYRDLEGRNEDLRFFRIIASKGGNEMGHLNFETKDGGQVWLYHIRTEDAFSHQGAGQAMLDVFEVFCVKHEFCRSVEGRYIPENSHTDAFYKKNDFDIYEDSYRWFVAKYLSKNKVLEKEKNFDGKMEVFDYKNDYKSKQINLNQCDELNF